MSVTYNTLPAPFVVNPQLTAIAIGYENEEMIADQVMPYTAPLESPSFVYTVRNKRDMFTLPPEGIKVSRKGSVPEVEWSATTASDMVDDYFLDGVVPKRDIKAATGSAIDPLSESAEQTMELVKLAREVRVSGIVFNTASYNGNSTTLSSTGQWSDYTNSDPKAAIDAQRDTMIIKPNQLVIGQLVKTKLCNHPKIVQAYHGNNGQYGAVPLQWLADYLEFDEIVVGKAWVNTARDGQTPNLQRAWGKHAAMLRTQKNNPNTKMQAFGVTARWGTPVSGSYDEPKKGGYGSTVVRAGESVKEKVLMPDAGFMWQNAIA